MIEISTADPRTADLECFLRAHLADLEPTAPPESRHALPPSAVGDPSLRLWTALEGETVVGTIGLAPCEAGHEELKTMRTAPTLRGRGIGRLLLEHAIADARERRIHRISLETGSAAFFIPARLLYRRAGFEPTGPFGHYTLDPHSVFMTLDLTTD